jgi:hypothetical protein
MAEEASEALVATIHAQYRFVDGYHVFTSEDVRGLYVASKDPEQAFDSVCPVLQELVTLKLKVPCTIEPTMTFAEFMAHVHERGSMPAAPVMASRDFIVRCAHAA